jgi:hypothetical protein
VRGPLPPGGKASVIGLLHFEQRFGAGLIARPPTKPPPRG